MFTSPAGQKSTSPQARLLRLGVLLLPVVLLFLAGVWAESQDKPSKMLWIGTATQILLSSMLLSQVQRSRTLGFTAIALYLIALVWLWLGLGTDLSDWYLNFAQAVLLIVSLILFAVQVVADSGAPELRHAYMLAQRLAERKDWPAELDEVRSLPDVKALREALHIDMTPVFTLMNHERPQVRIAALTALEFRRDWKTGQAEQVLGVAQRSQEPAVRAAAISALANVTDKELVEKIAEFMRDPAAEVRRAAAEATLWDSERRWMQVRHAVRRALSDAAHQDDGPILQSGQMLSAEAVADMNAWTAESGILAMRAALTLAVHYERAINENPDLALIQDLKMRIVDPHTPAVLRIELTQLLNQNRLIDADMQEKLLDPLNPAPLRVIAAERLLSTGAHAGAVMALRDVARMPNREIALAVANVVQNKLGIDMGLALGQPLPPLHSRTAAEVTRRVMKWALQGDPSDLPV
ncbi:MAG: HEAT repeat domain-containing protein [Gemmataceae bacterium]